MGHSSSESSQAPRSAALLVKRRSVVKIILAGKEPPKEDERFFLSMGREHQWRTLSPVTIKKLITEKAGVAPSAIIAMTQVRSGLAMECASDALRESILGVGPSLQKEEITIEPASDWTSAMVTHISTCVRILDRRVEASSEMVKIECQAACGVTPIQVHQIGRASCRERV